ncbi:MAG: phosphomannomutase/phosphoglucomutase, partial [candidate division Zixibacteria bacterium]|nr:phosphomannomutase/phosphoglucomutase [candidate division Zixibacteria bacterium]
LLAKTDEPLSQMRNKLPKTWQSPTMAPYCPDNRKYQVVSEITDMYKKANDANERICGHSIRSINTVNGVRVEYDDGSWGLVRASSNKPSLVIVIESLTGKKRLYEIFDDINRRLKVISGVGEYDQVLPPLEND